MRNRSFNFAPMIGLLLAAGGCSDGNAAHDGAAGSAGQSSGGSSGAAGAGMGGTAGGGSGNAGAGGTAGSGSPFGVAAGLPVAAPWGPSFMGIQNDEDPLATPSDDIGLGVVWAPEEVYVPYAAGDCIGFGTLPGRTVGQDAGTVTITGGTGDPAVELTMTPNGYYFFDNATDAWTPGDSVAIASTNIVAGPVTVPTAAVSSDIDALTSVSRSAPLTIGFSGSDASSVAVTVSGTSSVGDYLLACITASSTSVTIPAEALGSFPDDVTDISIKLTPANTEQTGDVLFLVGGASPEVDVALER